jgi:FMN phosphatase YigB (HAD superfamily)
MQDRNKIILTDCDGVLLNWEYAFIVWMERHEYTEVPGEDNHYDIGRRYGISPSETIRLIKFFNESAAIGFLPPLRDAIHYVRKLHEVHGYVFHCITSLSLDSNTQKLRTRNIQKLFGKTVFEKFIYLDTAAPKEEALEAYRNSGYLWIEDKEENAQLGVELGLDSILIEHGHNMNNEDIPLMKNWNEVYEYVTRETTRAVKQHEY